MESKSKKKVVGLFFHATDVSDLAVTMMGKAGYVCVAATEDPDELGNALQRVGAVPVVVIATHGDATGPLPIDGHDGDSFTAETLGKLLNKYVSSPGEIYFCSCNVGAGSYLQDLAAHAHGRMVYGPAAYCEWAVSSETCKIKSKTAAGQLGQPKAWRVAFGKIEDEKAVVSVGDWAGKRRNNHEIDLPGFSKGY